MRDAVEERAVQAFRGLNDFSMLKCLYEMVLFQYRSDQSRKGLEQLPFGQIEGPSWRADREHPHHRSPCLEGQMQRLGIRHGIREFARGRSVAKGPYRHAYLFFGRRKGTCRVRLSGKRMIRQAQEKRCLSAKERFNQIHCRAETRVQIRSEGSLVREIIERRRAPLASPLGHLG